MATPKTDAISLAEDLHKDIKALALNAEGAIMSIKKIDDVGRLSNALISLRQAKDSVKEARTHIINASAGQY